MMKKIITFVFILFSCFLLVGCSTNKTGVLDNKYYGKGEFTELQSNELDYLVSEAETFGVFIYQPLCAVSNDFEDVLDDFMEEYNINFYKMSFTNMSDTELKDVIVEYPSFVIYVDGEVVDYLDVNADSDVSAFTEEDGFYKWFTEYVKINLNFEYEDDEDDEKEIIYDKINVELKDVKYDPNKVNVYLFWGDGCPHCEHEKDMFDSIKDEYGDRFVLHQFETWYDEDNEKIMRQFASAMGDKVSGVPYTVIGKERFSGYSDSMKEQIIDAIENQYKNSYDVYFDESKK